MSRIIEYYLDPNDLQSIGLLQSYAINTPLILNGTFGNNINNSAIIARNGFSKFISITSAVDLGSVNFTIAGYQNGVYVTEVVSGPPGADNATTYSDNIYDSITSITANKVVANSTVEIGTATYIPFKATTTYSLPILVDSPYRKNINCIVTVEGAFNALATDFNSLYTLYGAIGSILDRGVPIPDMINQLVPIENTTGTTGTTFTKSEPYIIVNAPFSYLILGISTILTTGTDPEVEFPATVLRFSQSN